MEKLIIIIIIAFIFLITGELMIGISRHKRVMKLLDKKEKEILKKLNTSESKPNTN